MKWIVNLSLASLLSFSSYTIADGVSSFEAGNYTCDASACFEQVTEPTSYSARCRSFVDSMNSLCFTGKEEDRWPCKEAQDGFNHGESCTCLRECETVQCVEWGENGKCLKVSLD